MLPVPAQIFDPHIGIGQAFLDHTCNIPGIHSHIFCPYLAVIRQWL
jgi:hypothetical protein